MRALDYTAEQYLGTQLQTAETIEGDELQRIDRSVDAVVVGAGPGGLVTGRVLASVGLSVLVLEAGKFWRFREFRRGQTWANEHLYQEKGTRIAKGNTAIPVASGRGVGGGTLVNSGISFRAPVRVLDEWHDRFGVAIWAPERRDAIFEEVEEAIGVAPTDPSIAGENSEVARRGFERLGVDHGYMPRNTPACSGCGTCQTGCPTGGKASSDLNWLPAMLRDGGKLYADTRVEEITVENGRAVGVRGTMRSPETDDPVAEVVVDAGRVVLACGAIHTPMMLQRQGLADSSGHVGANLHIHPAVSVLARMSEEVKIWDGATQGYYAHHPTDPNILAETFSGSPEMLYTPGADIGHAGMEFLYDLPRIAGCGAMIRDATSGYVEPDGGSADITYFVEDEDAERLRKAFHFLSDMFFEAGAEDVQPLLRGADFMASRQRARQTIADAAAPADFTIYSSHPHGTCRMSDDPERGVVHPADGETHDLDHLHITDASVFPTALGVNPQMTIMGTALELARGIIRQG